MPDSKQNDASVPARHRGFGTPGRPAGQDLETTPEPLASRFRKTLQRVYQTQFLPVSVRVAPWRSTSAPRSTSPGHKSRAVNDGFDPQKAPTTPDSPQARLASKIARDSGASSGFFVVALRDSEPARANSSRFWALIGVATLAGVISTALGAAFLSSKQRRASVGSNGAVSESVQSHVAGARPGDATRRAPSPPPVSDKPAGAETDPAFAAEKAAAPLPERPPQGAERPNPSESVPEGEGHRGKPGVSDSTRDSFGGQTLETTSGKRKWKEHLEEFPVLE